MTFAALLQNRATSDHIDLCHGAHNITSTCHKRYHIDIYSVPSAAAAAAVVSAVVELRCHRGNGQNVVATAEPMERTACITDTRIPGTIKQRLEINTKLCQDNLYMSLKT